MLHNSISAQQTRVDKCKALYDSIVAYNVECPRTVLAIAIYETGWLECTRCTYKDNNLFGYRNNSGYIKFASVSDCLAYLKNWQDTYYLPWKMKHPQGTYYQFITHINYAYNMPNYIRVVKGLEKWVAENINEEGPAE